MLGISPRGNLLEEGDAMQRPLVFVAPHQGKSLHIGPYAFRFKAGRAVGSQHAIAEVTVPPGAINALHRHPCAETMYVLAGELEFFGEGDLRERALAGATIYV